MIRATVVTFVIILYLFIVGLPLVIHAWLTKNTDPLYRVGMAGGRLALWLSGVRLEVHGLEKIPHGRAAVYMSIHESICDPPAIIPILPPVLALVKQEFFRVPVMGAAMAARGYIAVDRKSRDRAMAAVERAAESLKAGKSFVVFPEGTRSPDGRLHDFKKGAFVMAIKAGAPIVPISISGARKVMPKGQFVIHPGRVRITIHDPIATENHDLEARQELMELTRQAIRKGLEPEEWPSSELKPPAE